MPIWRRQDSVRGDDERPMRTSTEVIAGVGLADRPRKSRWPARMDLVQSASGLVLGLFMWGHMFFVSSILVSKDFMWTITKMFEGYFFFGKAFPGIVSVIVFGIFVLIVLHAFLAMRKFPTNYRQYRMFMRAPEAPRARGHDALVGAGRDRVRAVLPRFGAPIPDAHASGRHRAARVGRPGVDRPLVADLPRHAVLRRAARRHRPLPPGGEVGLVRRQGPEREPQAAQGG